MNLYTACYCQSYEERSAFLDTLKDVRREAGDMPADATRRERMESGTATYEHVETLFYKGVARWLHKRSLLEHVSVRSWNFGQQVIIAFLNQRDRDAFLEAFPNWRIQPEDFPNRLDDFGDDD